MTDRPQNGEYSDFYKDYVARVPEGSVVDILASELSKWEQFLAEIADEQAEVRTQDGKWSIKEILGHLCDAERIFGYRALRISRGDPAPLAGFEQDDYVREGNAHARSVKDLFAEFRYLRMANIAMFRAIPKDSWVRMGTASNVPVSVRALAYITAGHEIRHLELLRARLTEADG